MGLQFSVLAIGIIVMQRALVGFDIGPDGIMAAGNPAQNGFEMRRLKASCQMNG